MGELLTLLMNMNLGELLGGDTQTHTNACRQTDTLIPLLGLAKGPGRVKSTSSLDKVLFVKNLVHKNINIPSNLYLAKIWCISLKQ